MQGWACERQQQQQQQLMQDDAMALQQQQPHDYCRLATTAALSAEQGLFEQALHVKGRKLPKPSPVAHWASLT